MRPPERCEATGEHERYPNWKHDHRLPSVRAVVLQKTPLPECTPYALGKKHHMRAGAIVLLSSWPVLLVL